MSKQYKGINSARLKTIYTRQDLSSWDSTYLPSILATPKEAPSISRVFILTPSKLDGRETHLLSTPECNAALLGLYHPHVIGLQEQRMLSPEPCQHPLWTFPGIDKTNLPPLKGIIDVAERLEFLDLLPRLKIENPKIAGESVTVIFPWIGDLIWALKPTPDNVFCVNWSIKKSYQDFKRPSQSQIGKTVSAKKSRAILGRHEMEKIYYEDAQIRTIQVADEAMDFTRFSRQMIMSKLKRSETNERYKIHR